MRNRVSAWAKAPPSSLRALDGSLRNRASSVHVFGGVTDPAGAGVGIQKMNSTNKPPWLAGLGTFYWAGVVTVGALLLYENLLVRADDFSRVNLAFFTVNGIISVLLAVLTVMDVIAGG